MASLPLPGSHQGRKALYILVSTTVIVLFSERPHGLRSDHGPYIPRPRRRYRFKDISHNFPLGDLSYEQSDTDTFAMLPPEIPEDAKEGVKKEDMMSRVERWINNPNDHLKDEARAHKITFNQEIHDVLAHKAVNDEIVDTAKNKYNIFKHLEDAASNLTAEEFRIAYGIQPFIEVIRHPVLPGVVTTIAGKDEDTYGLVDGTVTNALFNRPLGIAVDKQGNIYVSDSLNYAIRKITPSKRITTLAGGIYKGDMDGTGTLARFGDLAGPAGLDIDSKGRLIVADPDNHKIRRITRDGEVTTIGGLGKPHDRDGPSGVSGFHRPNDIAVDDNDNILVADSFNCKIRRIDPNGVAHHFHGEDLGKELNGEIQKFMQSYELLYTIDGRPPNSVFSSPRGIAYSKYSGSIYVADTEAGLIRKIHPGSNIVSTIAGAGYPKYAWGYKDGYRNNTLFHQVFSLVVGPDESVYVADTYNHCIRRVSPNGEVHTIAGKGTGMQMQKFGAGYKDGSTGVAMFFNPTGITIDDYGNLYITDTLNQCIRKLSPLGELEHQILYNTTVGDIATFSNNLGTFAVWPNTTHQNDEESRWVKSKSEVSRGRKLKARGTTKPTRGDVATYPKTIKGVVGSDVSFRNATLKETLHFTRASMTPIDDAHLITSNDPLESTPYYVPSHVRLDDNFGDEDDSDDVEPRLLDEIVNSPD